jgi:hypothetical protein
MELKKILFPIENRTFRGKRWLKVVVLNLHLVGVCGYAGGVLFDMTFDRIKLYLAITLITGALLTVTEIFSNCIWIIQNRGWMILLKILLIAQLHRITPYEKWGLLFIVFISGWVSHAKGNFRYYSIFHRKRVDAYTDLNSNRQ